MKSVRTTAAVFVLVAAAVAGSIIWRTQGDTSSGGSDSSRQRNTVFIPSSLDKTWGTDGLSLMTQPSNIEVSDMATTLSGTTYSVGTMSTPAGPRAVVFRTVDGKSYDVKYAINPLNEKLQGFGAFSSSIGRRISVDGAGNVWVVLTATTSTGTPTEYWAVTQMRPNLDYWATPNSPSCSSVCGAVYASSISVYDIQANFGGNKVLVATSQGMDLFNVTPGRPLPLGTVTITTSSRASDCKMTPTLLADEGSDSFVAVTPNGFIKNLLLVNYTGLVPHCASTIRLTSVSGIAASGGNVTLFGTFFEEIGFMTFLAVGDYLIERDWSKVNVNDIVGKGKLTAGQTVNSSWTLSYGAFTVQGESTETYIAQFSDDTMATTVFSSLTSAATGAKASSLAPMMTLSEKGIVLASSFTDRSSKGTAVATRFTLPPRDGLLTAPTFAASEQNISVTYGQLNSVPFARATNAESYSLASGSLPVGMSITPSGEIIGSPLSVGNYTARVRATNPAGSADTVLYIRSAATAPGAPTILGVNYGSPVTLIGYVEGAKGSDKDVVSAHFKGPDGATINQQCVGGTCVIVNRDLRENTDVTVTLTQSNESGTTDAINSIVVRRNVLPEPPTRVTVKGGPLSAVVTFTPSADLHGVEALTTVATVSNASDMSPIMTFARCEPENCILKGIPAGSGYVVTITIVTELGNVTSQPSAPFTVAEPATDDDAPRLATEDLTLPAHEDFVLPLVATGTGDISFDVNYDDLPNGVVFDLKTNSLVGALNVGSYSIRYYATDETGTTEGTVTITATPSQVRAPGMLPGFNTYDRKFSVFPFYTRSSDYSSTSGIEWTSTVTVNGKESRASGNCYPGGKCTLPNVVWGEDLILTMKALPLEESGDTESETNTFIVHVPELPAAVPTGKITLERMPDAFEGTSVIMGHVRMKPSMKFPLALGAAATVQVDATTGCDVVGDQVVLRLEGPRNGCSADPFVNLLSGDEIIANDDDGGAVSIPLGTDDDGMDMFDTFNTLSSRLSAALEPGDYTIEATSVADLWKDDLSRAEESDVEYDLWLTIITTPEEADRLMKADVVGTASTGTVGTTVTLTPDPAKETVIPADLTPAKSNALPAPVGKGNAAAAPAVSASAPSVVSLNVVPGSGKLDITAGTLGGASSDRVTVTANPGGRDCTAAPGNSCTITGLSPWISYMLTANVKGSQNNYTAIGRPTLQWKAGSKVKVSSLGLSAAGKTLGLGLKKGGVRVSGNCTLNAARSSISVGKAGVCTVTAMTTQKSKFAGPPLTATAAIK